MRIRFLPEAEGEFRAAAARYYAKRPGLAEEFAEAIGFARMACRAMG